MPRLDQVTICSADSRNPVLAAQAIERSMRQCEFRDAILFSDTPVDSPVRQVRIDRLNSVQDYSRFMLKRLHEFIETPYVLVVQWDGFVIDGTQWTDEFLHWDYIGSLWALDGNFMGMVMGNGGFSLRSRRLQEIVARLPIRDDEDRFEDRVMCQGYRRWLELERGIRFAPNALAQRFSIEYVPYEQPTFGFHSLRHLPRVLGEEATLRWFLQADPESWIGWNYLSTAARCLLEQRFELGGQLFAMAFHAHGEAQVRSCFEHSWLDAASVDTFMAMAVQAATMACGRTVPG